MKHNPIDSPLYITSFDVRQIFSISFEKVQHSTEAIITPKFTFTVTIAAVAVKVKSRKVGNLANNLFS